ncbi:uncharacterized protein LOC116068443 isoform X2 [Mastomys coucha]|uniref:uncharacterized protein LOC116068443 isoform X2 n=1 Tax=Mastomys coucha TaxID=35658 RepID=UPI001261D248|nr:uncharacterized protein LOC116068443 isoform X2 [Mastomys coucha]
MRLLPDPGRRLQPLRRRASPAAPVRSLAPSPASEPQGFLLSAGARLTCQGPSGGCGARPAPRGGPRPMGRNGPSRVRGGPAAGHGHSRDAARPAHPARSLRALAAMHAGSRWLPGQSSHPRMSGETVRRRRDGGLLVMALHSPGPGRAASRPGDEDLPASPARQAAAAAAAAGRLHCLTTARARLSAGRDLQELSSTR